MLDFSAAAYARSRGWDFGAVEVTAQLGLAEEDEEAIDRLFGVHSADYDPPTEAAAEEESRSVGASQTARATLLGWCRARVAESREESRS